MSALAGTGPLTVLALRRDRLLLPACVAIFAASAGGSAAATRGVYPDLAAQLQGAELVNSTPALLAMHGRIYDPSSLGAVSVFKLTGLGTAMVALFALLVVIRHTRADEELGRTELLTGAAVGRAAPLAAGVIVAAAGSLAVGLAGAGALFATGLPLAGSAAFGATWAVAGLAFTGIAAVAAQLSRSARAARGLAGGALAVAYLLRALGDTAPAGGPRWISWLSPIGLAQQIRPYAGDRWWVAPLPILVGAAAVGLGFVLLDRRDLDAGLLPQRPGPERAGRDLRGPFTLAWRLHRAATLGWLIGFVLLSMVVGQIISSIGDMLGTPTARQLILALGGVQSVTDAFLAVELSFVAVCAAGYGIGVALGPAAEEAAGRGELVGATAVSRTRWALGHLVVALAGSALLMLASGLAVGLAHATRTDDPGAVGRDLVAALVRLPAAWVLIGAAALLYGLSRRLAPLVWAVLVGTFLASEFGLLLDLPEWVRDLSPFSYVPDLPGGQVTAAPLLALLGVAAALLAAGLLALRRRDLSTA